MSNGIWGVVPIKDLEGAKQRLSPVLSDGERRALFREMLEDVLSAVCAATRLDGVLVVTRHDEVLALAERYGVRTLIEAENRGHTAAVTFAAQSLAAEGASTMLTIPGDVPLATPDEIDHVLAEHAPDPAVTIAPAHDKLGSNAVVCSPPGVLPLRFGDNSFYPHLDAARALGIEPRVVEQPGLALDVDTPSDLERLIARPAHTRTHAFLERSGIAARLTKGVRPAHFDS